MYSLGFVSIRRFKKIIRLIPNRNNYSGRQTKILFNKMFNRLAEAIIRKIYRHCHLFLKLVNGATAK